MSTTAPTVPFYNTLKRENLSFQGSKFKDPRKKLRLESRAYPWTNKQSTENRLLVYKTASSTATREIGLGWALPKRRRLKHSRAENPINTNYIFCNANDSLKIMPKTQLIE